MCTVICRRRNMEPPLPVSGLYMPVHLTEKRQPRASVKPRTNKQGYVCRDDLRDSYSENDNTPRLLFGRQSKTSIRVTSCVKCHSYQPESILKSLENAALYLPEGDEVVGICVVVQEKENRNGLMGKYSDLLSILPVDHPFLACVAKTVDGTELSEVWSLTDDEEQQNLDFHIVEDTFLIESIIGRTVFEIPLSFPIDTKDSWKPALSNEIEKLSEDINNGSMVFHLQNSKVLLCSDHCYGLDNDEACGLLFRYIEEEEDSKFSKRSSKKSLRCLNFTGYTDMSRNDTVENIPSCAPIISYKTETVKKVTVRLGVDTVTLLDPETPVVDAADMICKSVTNQLQAFQKCICEFSQGEKFVIPVPYHYQPLSLQTLVTVLHPNGVPDEQLEDHRRHIHDTLCLPADRPLFRRSNQFIFPGTEETGGYLVNIHEGLSGSKVTGGTQGLVSGFYTYHHYMQDRFDDNKWGCAYRSLQTLVSWFKLQGYTDRDVPSHREIQQTLVDIGDKEPKFVGSRQWIGSMEVSFVLDTLLGVSSKILSVSSGADMASKGRELVSHFNTQGTPVMIGGGVLAHTILGVDYNEVTGDIAFLILDPHYTGSEDKKVILDKGWCGWKGPDFWDQHAHYNMCLPQRPTVI